ncbi:glycoside hydrolase N-terminal domain-containing protein [Clostridium sp.]|uniref:glycosyl hydrolase family 95 catalytic domain-containing protein n=1 Tax=Clostridium sp. TaxID=1506 RepID=UPI001D6C1CEC|nr:glycoside hydrolase N-terminal domain-containing protein [Clostridium sp.]MBS5937297.1 glycoside hydrolase N-terminal domain-containing protein [Clostridium sp.]
MKRKKRIISAILTLSMLVSTGKTIFALDNNVNDIKSINDNELRLWYDSPAEDSYNGWEKWSLPIGNGHMGASIFGGVEYERVQLNEKTLWSGGPSESRPDYNGGNIESNATVKVNGVDVPIMKAIQDAFARGDMATANSLCNKLTGVSDDAGTKGYGYFLSYGNMYLDFKDNVKASNIKNYIRDLDLYTAISSVNYDYNNINYNREYFMSYPDNVMVTKLSASEKGKLSLDIRLEPDNTRGGGPNINNGYSRTFTKTAKDGLITSSGKLDDNQMKFNSQTKVINSGGTITDLSDGNVNVKDADEVLIITSIGTDYKNDYPEYRTGETDEELTARVNKCVIEASKKGYEGLLESHLSDYQGIFSRVDLDLGQTPSSMTTDKLLKKYNDGTAPESEQRDLEVMLFQYGRYLSIASSRDGSLPSNLQGVWAGGNNSPWHSDYHMNVNLQMNYWPSYSTNMAETALPLIDYIESLREPGRVTAEIYANIKSDDKNKENGFMAHTQNTPFGWTAPGWSFDWGWSPAAVPWILQNVWEYYEYTGDVEFMKTKIYPMLKEEAILYEQMLIEDPKTGKLVCSPAYSPEHGPRTNGNTYEQSLIWQMYEDVITAAKLVGEDPEVISKWEDIQRNLKGPIEIGDSGQIKEWYEETTLGSMGDKGHRHMSHLLGLFPGDLISVETPELLEAAIVSLNDRGDQSTGWAMGQRINTWARVGDGNRAYSLIRTLFKSGILTNLWDTHAPFQIDGNFGMTSGVAEMLMQSNMGYVNFMAAMPDKWEDGSVSGLIARGNFEIGMEWQDKQATKFTITSNNGGEFIGKYENIGLSIVKDSKGNLINYKALENEKIAFDTVKGETYTIINIPTSKLDAPTKLSAYRTSDESIDLEWDAVEGENVNYNVYRQIDKGDLVLVGKNIEATTLTDENAQDILGTFKYSISAVIDGNETKLSDSVGVKDLRNMAGYIDDQDPRITYVGSWGNWSEAVNHAGTVKYIETPNGNETAELTFVGTGIEVLVVTNADRGKYEVFIDGVSKGEVDTYSPSTVRKKVIYAINDLEKGKHTIKLRATATKNPSASKAKVELDAFKVIDNSKPVVTGIDVESKSGIYTLSKANSKLQMVANVTPVEGTNKEVLWKVTDSLGNATNLATIDENGLLTINSSNGVVKVTATSKENGEIAKSVDVKIAIPTSTIETIVEDAVNNNGWTKNPQFTWTGTWSTWAGEATKHHGGTKTETGLGAETIGSSIEYTFNGTGIDVYVHKHTNFASFDISIDGGEKTNYSLEGNDQGQSLLASFKNLENGDHTIKLTSKERSGKYQVNLDYFKVFTNEVNSPLDKNDLQTSIENNMNKLEKDYTDETWELFKEAYNNAVNIMNDNNAEVEEIKSVTKALNDASTALVEKSETTPPVIGNAKGEAIGIESTTLMLRWDLVQDSVKYNVYKVNGSTGEETFLGNTTNLHFRVNELLPKTEYEFKIKAVNKNNIEAELPIIKATTKAALDTERPSDVKNLKVSKNPIPTARISWDNATDNLSVKGYKIYVNGILLGTTVNTNYELTGLEYGKSYLIKVLAFDEAGNVSLNSEVLEINENEDLPEVDKDELIKLIAKAEELKEEDYTSESFANFKYELDNAKVILSNEGATQEEVNDAFNKLNDAITKLIKKPEIPEVDKIMLKATIEYAEEVKANGALENVVPAVVEEFNEALENAKDILADKNSTEAEVDEAAKRLVNIIHMLDFKKGDKEELKKLVQIIDALDGSKYKEATWTALQAELEKANKVIVDENAMEAEVKEAYNKLVKAYLDLRLVPDKSKLEELVNKAEEIDTSRYTKESVNVFNAKLKEAKVVLSNEDATQEEINKVSEGLELAIGNLELAQGNGNGSNGNGDGNGNAENGDAGNSDNNSGNNSNKLPITGGSSSATVGLFGVIVSLIGVFVLKRRKQL